MSVGKAVATNAAWLLIATTAQKAISFLSFTIVARQVGPATTGVFHFAVSITSIFVTLTDLGLTPILIREMAANEEEGRRLLWKAVRLKLLLIPLAVLGVITYAFATGLQGSTLIAVALACFVMSADAVSLIWYGAIRGRRELRHEAAGMFVGQLFTASVSISVAYLGYGVIGLVFGLLTGSTWNVLWSLRQARHLGLSPIKSRAWPIKKIFEYAWPFALAGIFVKIYSYVDTLLLKQFHPDEIVGHYAVAYKVTYALQFIPLAFIAALYPSMSAAFGANRKSELSELLSGSLRLMLLAGVPIAALLSALAQPIILVAYGPRFAGSITALGILPWVLIPIFLDFPVGALLNATRRAHLKTAAMGVAMLANVSFNFLLVPEYGATGAAWSGVISFWLLLFVGLIFIRKEVATNFIFSLALRGGLAALAIWYPTQLLVALAPWYIASISGVLLAILALFIFQLLTLEDTRNVLNWMKSRVSPQAINDEKL